MGIRCFCFIKDLESNNVKAVTDGDPDGFINAYLKALSLGEIEKN
ncbi:hypothetical protein [uncultured Ruminococcus sp.]|nr:hypothetical protein [uncultured Ruminococcus sp.]